mmetsp:Transcript_67255/g.162543  ORF Transcript_67255/g.162543 Transcript_67255/m.162543 type:complete len:100 (+) Transcript_67255:572-871(+)
MRVLQLQRLCPPVLAHGLTMTCDGTLQATGKQEGLLAPAAAMLNSLVVITMEESSSAGHVNFLNSTVTSSALEATAMPRSNHPFVRSLRTVLSRRTMAP